MKRIVNTQQEWLRQDVESLNGADAYAGADKDQRRFEKDNQGFFGTLSKVHPLAAFMRTGFLLGIRINIFGLATKLYPAMFKDNEWKDAGFKLDNAAKAKKGYLHVRRMFLDMGGNKKNLDEVILRGASKRIQKWNGKTKRPEDTGEAIVPPREFAAMHRMNILTAQQERNLINNIRAWMQYAKDAKWGDVEKEEDVKRAVFQLLRVPNTNRLDFEKAKTFGFLYIEDWTDILDKVEELTDPIFAEIKTSDLQKQNFNKLMRGWFHIQEDMAKKGNAGYKNLIQSGNSNERIRAAVFEAFRKPNTAEIDVNKTEYGQKLFPFLGIENMISWAQLYQYAIDIGQGNVYAQWFNKFDTTVTTQPTGTPTVTAENVVSNTPLVVTGGGTTGSGSYTFQASEGNWRNAEPVSGGVTVGMVLTAITALGSVAVFLSELGVSKELFQKQKPPLPDEPISEADQKAAFIDGVNSNPNLTPQEKQYLIDYVNKHGIKKTMDMMEKGLQSNKGLPAWGIAAIVITGLAVLTTAAIMIFKKKK